jgi:signal transduction histidine kinase
VDDVIREIAGNMQLVAQAKGVSLSVGNNPPCSLRTDPRLLRRLLYNLLDNAIKYTPATGQVTITVSPESAHWSVMIADTGVGIPPQHLPHVFERFYRADTARAEESGGAGLGLAICRSIAKNLGGTITLTSTPGCGTWV